jgi:hypothetical protein
MFFPIRYLLPTDVNVGLPRLWTQVQNLTKLWILCFHLRILETTFLDDADACAVSERRYRHAMRRLEKPPEWNMQG